VGTPEIRRRQQRSGLHALQRLFAALGLQAILSQLVRHSPGPELRRQQDLQLRCRLPARRLFWRHVRPDRVVVRRRTSRPATLPRTFAGATGPIGAAIAWLIAGTGMYMLARVFQSLAERKPDLNAGVFAYAKAGFGDYPGFLSAFGYWIGSCIGNVSYWVLIKSTLGAFFPVFGDGNTVVAIAVASVGIWLFHFLILRGVQQAAFINTVVTIAKIVPILAFILILFLAF